MVEHVGAPAAADPRVERIARIVLGVAVLWTVVVALRGVAGPLGAGQSGSVAASGVAGENVLRWHILAPVTRYVSTAPQPEAYAWHDPPGSAWATAIFVKLLGHAALACRLPPALACIAIPFLLYALGRALWGPARGALVALTFAVLPVVPAFASSDARAAPVIAGVLLCGWAFVRMCQTWRARWLVASLLGLVIALMFDWCAYAFVGTLLAFALLRRFAPLRAWFAPVDARRFAQWWALASGLTVVAFGAHAALLEQAHALVDFLTLALSRFTDPVPVGADVLSLRAYWQWVAFTPLAIAIGIIGLPVVLFRVFARGRDVELVVLALMVMAIADYEYVSSPDGIRTYWPWYFAPYVALCVGAISAGLEDAARFAIRRAGGAVSRAVLALTALVPLLIAPDGVRGQSYAYRLAVHGGDHGVLDEPALDQSAALTWLGARIDGPGGVAFSAGMRHAPADDWNVRHPIGEGRTASRGVSTEYEVIDSRIATPTELIDVAAKSAIEAVGPYWIVDHDAARAPIEGYAIVGSEARTARWYFEYPWDPSYKAEKDAWYTWELRDHLKQDPNPPPAGALATREHQRIGHNIAVSGGNTALAEKLEGELAADLDRSVATRYADGSELLGQIVDAGACPRITIYFRAGPTTASGLEFRIREVTERAPLLSLVPRDGEERPIAAHFSVQTAFWKPGYIYAASAAVRRRPGRTRYYCYWHSRASGPVPIPVDGPAQRTLLVRD